MAALLLGRVIVNHFSPKQFPSLNLLLPSTRAGSPPAKKDFLRRN
jgi:hypothetical protein